MMHFYVTHNMPPNIGVYRVGGGAVLGKLVREDEKYDAEPG